MVHTTGPLEWPQFGTGAGADGGRAQAIGDRQASAEGRSRQWEKTS
jgi:hypothetical protein